MTLQYWHEFRSRKRMFLRLNARVWCGILRYSSNRITLGIATRIRAACSTAPCSSSVLATPFSTSTSARLAPQMLIGSYDAFSTSTGVCIAGCRNTPTLTSRSVVMRPAPCPPCPACLFPLSPCFRIFPDCISSPPVPATVSTPRQASPSLQTPLPSIPGNTRSGIIPSRNHLRLSPRSRRHPNLGSPGPPQYLRASPSRSPRRINVVHQQNLAPSQRRAIANRKRTLQIPPSSLRSQLKLTPRILHPSNHVMSRRQLPLRTTPLQLRQSSIAQPHRLVIASLSLLRG